MMRRQLFLFVAGLAGAWVAFAYPAYTLWGEEGLIHSAVAVGLCLVPGLITLVWTGLTFAGKPDQQLMAVLGGTAVRLFVVAGAVFALQTALPAYRGWSFLVSVLVFYLFTLGLELMLLLPPGLDAAATKPAQSELKTEE